MRSWRSLPTGSSANAVTIAVSSPKQRFSPRATLYSPPPSHTSKDRAVAMRRSPGSSRTMTSPKLTRSQRHSFFGLTVNPMRSPRPPIQNGNCYTVHSHELRSMFPDSRLHFSMDPGWLQPRSQYMNQGKRQQVCQTGNKERNHVTSTPLEHMTDHCSDKQPPDRPGHPSESHDRAHRPGRKHIGGYGIEIGGKPLMTRGCKPDQQYGGPRALHAVGKDNRYHANRANEHSDFAGAVNAVSALNERGG